MVDKSTLWLFVLLLSASKGARESLFQLFFAYWHKSWLNERDTIEPSIQPKLSCLAISFISGTWDSSHFRIDWVVSLKDLRSWRIYLLENGILVFFLEWTNTYDVVSQTYVSLLFERFVSLSSTHSVRSASYSTHWGSLQPLYITKTRYFDQTDNCSLDPLNHYLELHTRETMPLQKSS